MQDDWRFGDAGSYLLVISDTDGKIISFQSRHMHHCVDKILNLREQYIDYKLYLDGNDITSRLIDEIKVQKRNNDAWEKHLEEERVKRMKEKAFMHDVFNDFI